MHYLLHFILLIWQMHLLLYMKRTAPLVAAWVPMTTVAWVPVTCCGGSRAWLLTLENMLLAKPVEERGSAAVTMVERYKIKYAVLINNAPDLPENLERRCCGTEEIHAIEMT